MKEVNAINDRLLSVDELAAYIGVKKSTLYSWIHGKKISYIKVGRLVKFKKQAIESWIEAHSVKENIL